MGVAIDVGVDVCVKDLTLPVLLKLKKTEEGSRKPTGRSRSGGISSSVVQPWERSRVGGFVSVSVRLGHNRLPQRQKEETRERTIGLVGREKRKGGHSGRDA